MARTITKETKRKGQGNTKRRTTRKNQKRERASPFHGRKLSHPWPFECQVGEVIGEQIGS